MKSIRTSLHGRPGTEEEKINKFKDNKTENNKSETEKNL